jgi:hypothetical protein
MYIHVDPDEWVNEVITHSYPNYGVTYKQRKATPEEYKENRRKRLQAEKEAAEANLSRINSELGKL